MVSAQMRAMTKSSPTYQHPPQTGLSGLPVTNCCPTNGRSMCVRGLVLLTIAAACGCSQSDFATAPAEGIVKCQGTLLTSGVVYFAPIGEDGQPLAGKSGGGVVGADGHFTVSTYREGDGAVVGRHRVVWQAEEEHAGGAGAGCSREAFAEIEIPSGGDRNLLVDLREPIR